MSRQYCSLNLIFELGVVVSGPKYYQSLVQSPEISPSDKQISLDLHRSFPKNVHFSGDQGAKVGWWLE